MFLLGFDLGTSSIKVALVNADNGQIVATAQSPDTEMPVQAPQPDWAEQDPAAWWEHMVLAARQLFAQHPEARQHIEGIGIAYQMHGLVLVDEAGAVLRPSIIWCDSRAVEIGKRAAASLSPTFTYGSCLNTPGNFTASKLRWVKEHEPDLVDRAKAMMLPGDFAAFRLTGKLSTTASGLSEGVLWNFSANEVATDLFEHYELPARLIPELVPTFGLQGRLTSEAADELGLPEGIPVTYRAGDQPNNAFALGVLAPGEVAATGGTSGVVYAVTDQLIGDVQDRVNSFAHVNHQGTDPRIGVLLCINGAGSMYAWLRQQLGGKDLMYAEMEAMASQVEAGSEGLRVLPFGNGAERLLNNENPGAHVLGLHFARHGRGHLVRATLEGIAFAFVYGMEAMKDMGMKLDLLRVGNDNLFRSAIFAQTVSTLTGASIEVRATSGAVGAAIGAGFAHRGEAWAREALAHAGVEQQYEPAAGRSELAAAFADWQQWLERVRK